MVQCVVRGEGCYEEVGVKRRARQGGNFEPWTPAIQSRPCNQRELKSN